MTSSVGVQYPQYPFFYAAPNYNYDDFSNSRGGHIYSHPIDEDTYTSSSGSSGYGDTDPSGYGPSHYSSDHPTGPSSTGYSAPVVHAPPPAKSFFGHFKKGGSSAMSALTLLSFFFFVNLLQSCIKEHIDTMNPTVMVLTNNFRHKSDNNDKIVEINSREQTSSPASTPSSNNKEIVEADHIDIVSSIPAATIAATLSVVQHKKPAFENVGIVNSNHNTNSNPYVADQPDSYDQNSYRNRSGYLSFSNQHSDRYRPQHYYDDDDYMSPYHGDGYPWSHHTAHSHYRHRFHDPFSSYWDEYDTRRFPNHDAYDETSYLRIY